MPAGFANILVPWLSKFQSEKDPQGFRAPPHLTFLQQPKAHDVFDARPCFHGTFTNPASERGALLVHTATGALAHLLGALGRVLVGSFLQRQLSTEGWVLCTWARPECGGVAFWWLQSAGVHTID